MFANCMLYNAFESELYKAAVKLEEKFEILLCDWVYNVQVLMWCGVM